MKKLIIFFCLVMATFQAWSQWDNFQPRNRFYNRGNNWNTNYRWRNNGIYISPGAAIFSSALVTLANVVINVRRVPKDYSYDKGKDGLIDHGDGWYSIRLKDPDGNVEWKSFYWQPGQKSVDLE